MTFNPFHFPSLSFVCFRSLSRCADALTKAVQDLIALVKQLREDVAHQTTEINHLRRMIESCAGCREPVQIVRESCQNSNPCFEGVTCYDAESGPRCGRCPSGEFLVWHHCRRRLFIFNFFFSKITAGYVGDGKHCKPGLSCNDRPCFP